MTSRAESFPPEAGPASRVLILGSFPSVKSLADAQYYAHPQNAFWPIMGELFGAGRDKPYRERLRILRDAGVALWDSARRCAREGSADATMRDIEPNDVPGLLRRRTGIGVIFCNGRKSEELFRRLVLPDIHREIEVRYLPSTSPANASVRPAEKLRAWRAIPDWLDQNP